MTPKAWGDKEITILKTVDSDLLKTLKFQKNPQTIRAAVIHRTLSL